MGEMDGSDALCWLGAVVWAARRCCSVCANRWSLEGVGWHWPRSGILEGGRNSEGGSIGPARIAGENADVQPVRHVTWSQRRIESHVDIAIMALRTFDKVAVQKAA